MIAIKGQDITELRDLCTIADIRKWFSDKGFISVEAEQDTVFMKDYYDEYSFENFSLRFMLTNTTKVDWETDQTEHCLYLCTHFDDGKVDPLLAITKRFREEIDG